MGHNDAIWRQGSGSTLAQVMACCLAAPSHSLNQCWLIIRKVQWYSSVTISQALPPPSITEISFKSFIQNSIAISQGSMSSVFNIYIYIIRCRFRFIALVAKTNPISYMTVYIDKKLAHVFPEKTGKQICFHGQWQYVAINVLEIDDNLKCWQFCTKAPVGKMLCSFADQLCQKYNVYCYIAPVHEPLKYCYISRIHIDSFDGIVRWAKPNQLNPTMIAQLIYWGETKWP